MEDKPDADETEKRIEEEQGSDTPTERNHERSAGRLLKIAGTILGLAVAIVGIYVGYTYASSPISIREPLLEHYHFRMQVVIDGKPVNFADAKYQTPYSADNCNAALPERPIHLHDNRDQFVHIHWEGITGGQVLKNYGWNLIGGSIGLSGSSLGYRFDNLPKLKKVPIHGKVLPAIPSDANFYIYSQKDGSYTEKKFEDFTRQDLEQFFGTTSNFPAHKLNQDKRGLLDTVRKALIPTIHAHADNGHGHDSTGTMSAGTAAGGVELTRINNLVGDVVLFVQKAKPSDQQIKQRFDNLVPLSDSTCGG